MSPRMKRPVQRRENSVEKLSEYFSPGGVSLDTSPRSDTDTKSQDFENSFLDDKHVTKRRLFSNSPAKVLPKKQKVPPLMQPSSVYQEEFDENIILLD